MSLCAWDEREPTEHTHISEGMERLGFLIVMDDKQKNTEKMEGWTEGRTVPAENGLFEEG